DQCPSYAEDYFRQSSNASSTAPKVLIEDTDFAAIYFSSGTTGFPKPILLKHQALSQSAAMEAAHHQTTKNDCFLCIPPLYHTGAKMHWFGSLYTGSRAVLLKGNTPKSIFQAVSNEGCTNVWLLVPWAQDILAELDAGRLKIEDYQLHQWRLMHIGAQPVPPSLIRHWMEYFPHHQYDTNYGLSESTGPGCVHLGIGNTHKVGAIGIPGVGWKTKIVDPEGNPVEQGTVGELCVKGPGVMVEYYKNPEATAEVLKNGWLHTGDMAMQDEDGFIFLVDRKKDVIISGGENLYPVQIESFLAAHPKIHDVAVIGLPDHRQGEIAAAIIQVVKGETLTEDEVNHFCLDLPRYKRPRKLIFADVIRNATGKIDKPKLREIYGGTRLVEQQNRS
ncbi:MAG: long-chain fatty acid--CoA ligase, partial [Lachnospiraceae bacterium]|nr:long-chain fatty acid--CoA ligase [Lachnospiraceae bacterium]